MKAALQNLVLYLLCMASVVLAAPTQSTLYPQPLEKGDANIFAIPSQCKERPSFSQQKVVKRTEASILEGSTRFELW